MTNTFKRSTIPLVSRFALRSNCELTSCSSDCMLNAINLDSGHANVVSISNFHCKRWMHEEFEEEVFHLNQPLYWHSNQFWRNFWTWIDSLSLCIASLSHSASHLIYVVYIDIEHIASCEIRLFWFAVVWILFMWFAASAESILNRTLLFHWSHGHLSIDCVCVFACVRCRLYEFPETTPIQRETFANIFRTIY